jgi:hypothetical protein
MRKRWEPAGVTEEDRNLLAVATLADGLPLEVLKNPPVGARLPALRAYSPDRYRVMCGRPSDGALNPLTPGVLGEFFVLEHLRPSHSIDPRPSELIEMALALPSTRHINSMSYGWRRGEESERIARLRQHLYFVGQCARDFPDHPSLGQLMGPLPEPNDNSWGWAVDVANLIEELLICPGSLDFCNHLHDALFEVAVARATTRAELPALRTCTTGIARPHVRPRRKDRGVRAPAPADAAGRRVRSGPRAVPAHPRRPGRPGRRHASRVSRGQPGEVIQEPPGTQSATSVTLPMLPARKRPTLQHCLTRLPGSR